MVNWIHFNISSHYDNLTLQSMLIWDMEQLWASGSISPLKEFTACHVANSYAWYNSGNFIVRTLWGFKDSNIQN